MGLVDGRGGDDGPAPETLILNLQDALIREFGLAEDSRQSVHASGSINGVQVQMAEAHIGMSRPRTPDRVVVVSVPYRGGKPGGLSLRPAGPFLQNGDALDMRREVDLGHAEFDTAFELRGDALTLLSHTARAALLEAEDMKPRLRDGAVHLHRPLTCTEAELFISVRHGLALADEIRGNISRAPIEALCDRAIGDEEPPIRMAALAVLVDEPDALKALVQALFKDGANEEQLLFRLQHDEPSVGVVAALELARTGSERALPPLDSAAASDEPLLAEVAKKAALKIRARHQHLGGGLTVVDSDADGALSRTEAGGLSLPPGRSKENE